MDSAFPLPSPVNPVYQLQGLAILVSHHCLVPSSELNTARAAGKDKLHIGKCSGGGLGIRPLPSFTWFPRGSVSGLAGN